VDTHGLGIEPLGPVTPPPRLRLPTKLARLWGAVGVGAIETFPSIEDAPQAGVLLHA
jgi:hypothetical protein